MAETRLNGADQLRRFKRNAVTLGLLWVAVMLSGIGVVYSTHLSRQLFNELEGQRRTAAELHVEWGQYLLEQSTWAAYSRVERIAAEKLEMESPAGQQIIVVQR